MPPTLVFDLDGTLVDSARDLVNTLNAVLAAEGMAPVSFEAVVAMVGRGSRVLIQRAYAAAGRDVGTDELDRLQARFIAHYEAHLTDHTRPFPGAVEALDRFAARGWHLAVCTNKYERMSRDLLAALDLADRFAVIAGQDTFGVSKPDPGHILETIRAAGGDPHDAVMVGDSANDIDAANAAGVPVIAVTFGYTPVPAAKLGATRVIDSFDDLDAAVAAIRSA
jgi:phosphoglycolate phosphatase